MFYSLFVHCRVVFLSKKAGQNPKCPSIMSYPRKTDAKPCGKLQRRAERVVFERQLIPHPAPAE
jgi:hypothetical protein